MMHVIFLIFLAIAISSCDRLDPFGSKLKENKNYQLSVLLCYLPTPKLSATEPLIKYASDPNLLAARFAENASMEFPKANFAVSVDRGSTWKFFNVSETIRDFSILSSEKYFVISNEAIIFTLDGGQTWNKRSHNIDLSQDKVITLFSARPERRLILILRKVNSNYVYTSVDEGLSWNQTVLNGNLINDESFQNSRSRILTSSSNTNGTIGKFYLYESSEMGDQYQLIFEKALGNNPSNQVVPTRIYFEDQNKGYLSGNTLIYKTMDGGLNWSEFSTSSRGSVFYSEGNVLFYAARNFIQKSVDGGNNWSRIKSNFSIIKFYNLNSFYGKETGKNFEAYYNSFDSEGIANSKLTLNNWNGFTYQNNDFAICRKSDEPLPVNINDF